MNFILDPQYLIIPLFLVCLILSCVILKYLPNANKKFDSLNRSSSLDGLRGILALSVLVHHFYITYIWKTNGIWVRPESDLLNNLGAISVSLFFLITGFLFFNKIKKSDINWWKLYKSRFKRIVPLYFFVVFIVVFISLNSTNISENSLADYLKWLFGWLFFKGGSLNDFNSSLVIAGVNWTLIYEWGFYFALPLFYALIHNKIQDKFFFYGSVVLFIFIFLTTKRSLYLLFIFSYLSIMYQPKIIEIIKIKKLFLNILIPIVVIVGFFFTTAYSFTQKILVAFIFSFIANGYDFWGVLNSKGLKILGDISYSVYLVHGLILYLFFTVYGFYDFDQGLISYYFIFPFMFFIVLFCSFCTYFIIERPFLKQ